MPLNVILYDVEKYKSFFHFYFKRNMCEKWGGERERDSENIHSNNIQSFSWWCHLVQLHNKYGVLYIISHVFLLLQFDNILAIFLLTLRSFIIALQFYAVRNMHLVNDFIFIFVLCNGNEKLFAFLIWFRYYISILNGWIKPNAYEKST